MSAKYVNCPVCRGYALESQWCGNCNKTGMVIEKTQANRLAFLENCKKQDGDIKMSTKYEDPKLVPTSVLIERLKELADAIAKGNRDELTMRIPAEVDRDADIVLMEAAKRLEFFRL